MNIQNVSSAQSKKANQQKYYDIKSGKIVFKFFDGMQEGEKTLTFDEWGNFEKLSARTRRVDSVIKGGDSVLIKLMESQPKETNILLIRKPGLRYEIDIDKNEGVERKSIMLSPQFNFLEMMGKKVAKDTILGKPCDVYEISGGVRIWMWKRIALKKQFSSNPDDNAPKEYAVTIEEDYKINPGEFEVPKGVTIKSQ